MVSVWRCHTTNKVLYIFVFIIFQKEETNVTCSYTQSQHSMSRHQYHCVFFVARKPLTDEQNSWYGFNCYTGSVLYYDHIKNTHFCEMTNIGEIWRAGLSLNYGYVVLLQKGEAYSLLWIWWNSIDITLLLFPDIHNYYFLPTGVSILFYSQSYECTRGGYSGFDDVTLLH